MMFKYLKTILYISLALISSPALSNSLGLIITIGEFKSSGIPPLPGTQHDSESARKIATNLGFSGDNFIYLKDADATRSKIIEALKVLASKADPDSDVFVYFSGHGTRFTDPKTQKCQEAFVPYDTIFTTSTLTESDFGMYLNSIAKRARRVLFMVDTCHAAGYSQRGGSRTLSKTDFLVPKFSLLDGADQCGQTSNLDTKRINSRSLSALRTSLFENNVVKISAARVDEVAWSSPRIGGLATHAFLKCIEGDARDLDRSGSISTAELQVCAQQKMNDPNFGGRFPPGGAPSNITVSSSQRIVFPGLGDGINGVAPPLAVSVQQEMTKILQEREKSERQRIAQERAELDRIEKQKVAAERDRQEREKSERQRIAQERAELDRIEKQKVAAERDRQEREKSERQRIAQERAELDRVEKQKVAAERDRQERERKQLADQQEHERRELERLATETAERIRVYQYNLDRIQNRLKAEFERAEPEIYSYQDALATLTDIYEQRNPQYRLQIIQPRTNIQIHKDDYSFTVSSSIQGYLYVLHLGSDKRTFTLLFPNKYEEFNTLPANTKYRIPGPNWNLKARGPEGKTHLLVLVSRIKLDLTNFGLGDSGIFAEEDARIENRRSLTKLFSQSSLTDTTLSFGASLFSVVEKK